MLLFAIMLNTNLLTRDCFHRLIWRSMSFNEPRKKLTSFLPGADRPSHPLRYATWTMDYRLFFYFHPRNFHRISQTYQSNLWQCAHYPAVISSSKHKLTLFYIESDDKQFYLIYRYLSYFQSTDTRDVWSVVRFFFIRDNLRFHSIATRLKLGV